MTNPTSAGAAAGHGARTSGYVGRLAPSPTGALHLGNARTFLLAWLAARSRGGTLRLRIEDIDGPRIQAGAAAATLDDLRWLGLDWDGEVWVQSQRLPVYADAVARLFAAGHLYPCVCTRAEIDRAASAPHGPEDDGPVYPGTCRGRFPSLAAARAATGREPALRFGVAAAALPFVDGCAGPQAGILRGDFVVQKRDGGPAYQLAVVVDDHAQGITEVVRADDLLPSTPRQLALYRALGLQPPAFRHVPLVVGGDGLRLAKRHGDTSLRHLRAQGVAAAAVVGHLGWLAGLVPRGTSCLPADLLPGFAFERLPAGPVRGDEHGLLG
ncbi:MAG: tRNA glutamyl-Q(34) synthetase GluQRS [Planctomycetes bacterium]|nr:tRNA glutamyl-Q(34) synthetase GluQRS [Planctomycetota bacterium]